MSSKRPSLARRSVERRGFLQLALAAGAGLALGDFARRVGHAAPSDKWLTIANIERTTVKLPYRAIPARHMARELPHWAWTEIVEVELASGHKGFGETLLYYTWGATGDEDVELARGKNAAALMWQDELGAGLQQALFDAVAKAADVPTHALLGEKLHDSTPVGWWNIDTSPEDMAVECKEAYRQGYRGYKTKGRPWYDVWEQVEQATKAVPREFQLAIDFNDTLLDAKRGIPILKELEQISDQYLLWETPIYQSDIAGNQAIRRACRGKVAMHYGTPSPRIAVREDVCDGFVVGGGAREVMQEGTVAAMADKPFWLQLVGSSITTAWSLQLGGVLSHATWPSVNCHQLYEHQLLTEPIVVEDGKSVVRDRPGNGYELDRGAIERFRVTKPASRPNPPRLIETVWPDGRKMYFASTEVNFVLNAARQGKVPYFERGVKTDLVPDDGTPRWRELHDRALNGPFLLPA